MMINGRHSGLMVSALVSGSSGLGSSPGRGHCVVFLGKTLNSHSAKLVKLALSCNFERKDNICATNLCLQHKMKKLRRPILGER